MIIGVSGFSWSGSGAVIDYLMEFPKNQIYANCEFTLAYHPDGLLDLDRNLNENCAKFLSSGVAIPRFRKLAKMLLSRQTKGEIVSLTDEYLKKLVQADWVGLEAGQVLLHNKWIYNNIASRVRHRIITKLPMEFCWRFKPYPLAEMEFSIRPENFSEATLDYTSKVLRACGLNLDRPIVLDQPFPGNNPVPYMKYYQDAKAIVVDRDPRDVFIFLRAVFPGHSYSIPLQDVKEYVAYYKYMHKDLKKDLDDKNVLYIRFEDLIYEYEKTSNRINDFLGLSFEEHKYTKKYFVPEDSMSNTQVYKKYGNYQNEIIYIEKYLKDYLYDFDQHIYRPSSLGIFDDNPRSKKYQIQKTETVRE